MATCELRYPGTSRVLCLLEICCTFGKIRNSLFQSARATYRYSEYDIQAYATIVANQSGWIASKVDSATQQKLATRAFQASEKVIFGRAKKVRFKVSTRFNSMEGKTNKQGIRWVDGQLVWGKLRLNAMIDPENPVMMHGLTSKIKYVRLLKKEIHSSRRWFAQLVCEGVPFQKFANFVTPGIVGVDLNISNVAYSGFQLDEVQWQPVNSDTLAQAVYSAYLKSAVCS